MTEYNFHTKKRARKFMERAGNTAKLRYDGTNEYSPFIVEVKDIKTKYVILYDRVIRCNLCGRKIEIGEKQFYHRITICKDCIKGIYEEMEND